MKLAQSHRLVPPPSSAAGAEPRLTLRKHPTGGMATAESKAASADSELQHSFGPGGVGFDFLPLELPGAVAEPPLPTKPAAKVPVVGLESSGPLPVTSRPQGADAPRSPASPRSPAEGARPGRPGHRARSGSMAT